MCVGVGGWEEGEGGRRREGGGEEGRERGEGGGRMVVVEREKGERVWWWWRRWWWFGHCVTQGCFFIQVDWCILAEHLGVRPVSQNSVDERF